MAQPDAQPKNPVDGFTTTDNYNLTLYKGTDAFKWVQGWDILTANKYRNGTYNGDMCRIDEALGNKISKANNVITGNMIVEDTITDRELAPAAVIDVNVASGISGSKIADNTLDGAKIVGTSITKAKMATNSVGKDQIEDDAILARHIKEGEINSSHFATGATLPSALIGDKSILSQHFALADNKLTGSTAGINAEHINDKEIIGNKLADVDVITRTSQIKDWRPLIVDEGGDQITGIIGSQIRDETISSSKLLPGIPMSKISSSGSHYIPGRYEISEGALTQNSTRTLDLYVDGFYPCTTDEVCFLLAEFGAKPAWDSTDLAGYTLGKTYFTSRSAAGYDPSREGDFPWDDYQQLPIETNFFTPKITGSGTRWYKSNSVNFVSLSAGRHYKFRCTLKIEGIGLLGTKMTLIPYLMYGQYVPPVTTP